MVKVKICGITRMEDALFCAENGADFIGLNFYKKSPRYMAPDEATAFADYLRQELGVACPLIVGVFVNELVSNISLITTQVGLNFAQLHGDESAEMLRELRGIGFKAIQPMNEALAVDDVNYFAPTFSKDERVPSILVDAYHPSLRGGTGEQTSLDVALAVKARVPRLMLAGGLTPDNIAEHVQTIQPWAVDVASGVESGTAGIKDLGKVRAFIEGAKG